MGVRGSLRLDDESPDEVGDGGDGNNAANDTSCDRPCTRPVAAFVTTRGEWCVLFCTEGFCTLSAVQGNSELTALAWATGGTRQF